METQICRSRLQGLALRKRSICPYASPLLARQDHRSLHQRHLHTSSRRSQYIPQQPAHPQERPRWAQTPPLMTAPYRIKPLPEGNEYPVNEDPAKLDKVYNNMLGEKGDQMLTDEVKWLAVTHKSFDHGRRGYNDRLSLIGRMISELQTSLALIHDMTGVRPKVECDHYNREPFQHIALEGLNHLTEENKRLVLYQRRVSELGERYGLHGVLRWKPRKAKDLEASGIMLVTQQALYAIVGAVAMQRGGQVANEVVRARILRPMGMY